MKTLSLLLALLLLTPALHAADDTQKALASFISRVLYAKANAKPDVHYNDSGELTCNVYTVKQGPGNTPGYSLIVAKDQGYAPIADIAVLCDSVAIDETHSIRCTGHILTMQSRWLTTGGEGMEVIFGLGKKDDALKTKGPRKSTPV